MATVMSGWPFSMLLNKDVLLLARQMHVGNTLCWTLFLHISS